MLLRAFLALGLLAFAAMQPAEAQINKKKPKLYDSGSNVTATGIYAPDGSGEYFFREVFTCKAKWYSDGMLKECFSPTESKRTRLEGPSSSSYDSVPGDRVYYDPGQGAEVDYTLVGPTLLLVWKDDQMITVSLPSGKQTVVPYAGWVPYVAWPSMPGTAILDAAQGARPWTVRWAQKDGTITPTVANSDLNRLVDYSSAIEGCTERSRIAAAPPESTAIAGWAEIRRRALLAGGRTGPADLSADGTPTEKCARYMSHFFLGNRSSDGQWQVLRAFDGAPVGGAFASAEAAEAAAPGLLAGERLGLYATVPYGDTALLAAVSDAQKQLYADKAAAAQAAEAARVAAEQAEAARQQAAQESLWAEARSRAEQYFAAGHYGMAAQEAEALPVTEWADYVLAWRGAPVEEINRVRKRFEAEGYSRTLSQKAGAIDTLWNNLVGCEGHLKDRNGNYFAAPKSNRWHSTGPVIRAQEMMTLLAQSQYGMLSPGEILVFDATLYDWVVIYEPDPARRSSGTRVINIPGDGVADDQTLSWAQQNYDRCVREARER